MKFRELFTEKVESLFGDYIFGYDGSASESFLEVKRIFGKLPSGLRYVSAKHGIFITGNRDLDLSKFKGWSRMGGSK